MGDELLDPSEVNKDPQLIKGAQAEIGKLDVLVCGECHDVFHYIEQFQEHRLLGKCPGKSAVVESCINELKPQVWAFMLWKNAKFKAQSEVPPSSWSVYQLWCNLAPEHKEAWIAAGKSIQSFTKISHAKVQEVRTKVQANQPKNDKTPPTSKTGVQKVTGAPKSIDNKEESEEPLEEGEIRLSQLSESQRRALKVQTDSNSGKLSNNPLDSESDVDTEEEVEREIAKLHGIKNESKRVVTKSILKPVQLNSDVTILPSTKKNGTSRKALRTDDKTKATEEYVVEKIISRRYNPGKKTFEYLLKWENLEENKNTWEPAAHLEPCKHLLDEFEMNLKKQKAQKVIQKPSSDKLQKKAERQSSTEEMIFNSGGKRPQRTSKQKALNQVKVWCGSMSDADDPSGKRVYSDSDSDSVEKKIKMEAESSDSEDEKPTIKKIKTPLNGVGGKRQILPENILVPDSQGIVRINQKQLPSLSSGVYVMSKTAGIIKLDSNTSKLATSGGHAVIKVAPKIGQTSIKVIKKDTNVNTSKFATTFKKTPAKTYTPKIVKKTPVSLTPKKEPEPEPILSDESDGIEELEFPTDLPLPSPDSPPGEFTLCPMTGKVLGQEYPEIEEKIKVESPQEDKENSLDNIVNLAAADILTDKDSSESKDPDLVGQSTLMEVDTNDPLSNVNTGVSESNNSLSQETVTSSILSTALTNANIGPSSESNISTVHKKSITATNMKENTEMNRNVINRTIVPKPAAHAVITRIGSNAGSQKNKVFTAKTTSVNVQNQVKKSPYKQTYSKNPIRKIGNTTVYQTTEVSRPIVSSPAKAANTTSASVINMPLLTEQEPNEEVNLSISQDDNIKIEPSELNTLSLNENETPLLITGEDGTIYQVAGQNEDGQTILITQDADGQQQCLLVASENAADLAQVAAEQPVAENINDDSMQVSTETEMEGLESENNEDSQVVAQIVSAQPPSPGGTRKVVLMLPDGNLMMTEVTAEQYAALELDK